MPPPIHLQLDIDRRPRPTQVRLDRTQRLHQRRLQRPAPRLCLNNRCIRKLWLDEFLPLHQLVRHGLSKPKHHELRDRRPNTLLLPAQEYLDPSLPMGTHILLLQDIQ